MADFKIIPQELTAEEIRNISEVVYRIRLEQDCKTNVERMLAKDKSANPVDNGEKLRVRAAGYDATVKAVMQAIGISPPGPQLQYLIAKGLAGPFNK